MHIYIPTYYISTHIIFKLALSKFQLRSNNDVISLAITLYIFLQSMMVITLLNIIFFTQCLFLCSSTKISYSPMILMNSKLLCV